MHAKPSQSSTPKERERYEEIAAAGRRRHKSPEERTGLGIAIWKHGYET
jgi:hypothetical protein